MNEFKKQSVFKGVTKRLAMPLLAFGVISAYVVVSGKMGTCGACVAVTDFIFGPEAKATPEVTGAWSFPTLEGGTFHSDDLKGDVAVVTFWATWCPPCRKEIPALQAIQERYSDKGVKVISISVDEGTNEELTKKVKRLGVDYPVLRAGDDIAIPSLFGTIRSIPTVFIFNRDQEIAFREVGYVSEKELEKQIQKVL